MKLCRETKSFTFYNIFVWNLLCTSCTHSLHPHCTQKLWIQKAWGALAPAAPMVPASLPPCVLQIYNKLNILACTHDSVSGVASDAGTNKWSIGVGAGSISVTIVRIYITFVNFCINIIKTSVSLRQTRASSRSRFCSDVHPLENSLNRQANGRKNGLKGRGGEKFIGILSFSVHSTALQDMRDIYLYPIQYNTILFKNGKNLQFQMVST
jgi:hypothetical protein